MTDFNSLPLADQLKALQAGDELHLRGGGWLPFVSYNNGGGIWSHCVRWYANGDYRAMNEPSMIDIIRVIRPTVRKVPEVVEKLRTNWAKSPPKDPYEKLQEVCDILADHFERNP